MRLTLRTLLAWLDDSLPPKDVTRIGRQLHKSKFAQDLSRRIRKVVRQRRLTVPGMGKNTPIDANVIAAYLDNNLSPDQTTAVESLCLNSDVHLAEVAASHEILTILDQPVEIRPETYSKYYRLVKGPEARIPADRWNQLSQKTEGPDKATPLEMALKRAEHQPGLAAPSQAFTSRTPLYAAGILSVLVGMIAAYQWLLTHYGEPRFPVAQPTLVEKPTEVAVAQPAAEPKPDPAQAEPAKTEPAVPEPAKVADIEKPMPAAPPAKAEQQPGAAEQPFTLPASAAVQDHAKTGFILFSPTPVGQPFMNWTEPNPWERLGPQSTFNNGAVRFASPEPAAFETDQGRMTFHPGTLVEYRGQGGPILHSGELRVATKKEARIEFQLDRNLSLRIQTPADSVVLISRSHSPVSSKSFIGPGPIAMQTSIAMIKGTAVSEFGGTMHNLNQHQVLTAEPSENGTGLHFRTVNQESLKDWPETTNSEKLTAEMLGRYFKGNRSLPVALVEAESDMMKPVRDQALKIAIWLDRDDLVMSALTDQASQNLNTSAIEALRTSARSGSPAAARIFAKLARELEMQPVDQAFLARLLGDPELKADQAWKKQLVALLEHNSSLIRQLTLQQLMSIAGRDDMGYDPLAPSAKGIQAWQTWLGVKPETKP